MNTGFTRIRLSTEVHGDFNIVTAFRGAAGTLELPIRIVIRVSFWSAQQEACTLKMQEIQAFSRVHRLLNIVMRTA